MLGYDSIPYSVLGYRQHIVRRVGLLREYRTVCWAIDRISYSVLSYDSISCSGWVTDSISYGDGTGHEKEQEAGEMPFGLLPLLFFKSFSIFLDNIY